MEKQQHQSKTKTFDVIVLGVGSMGSAACYYLAKNNASVLGIEQFNIPNELSSHTGQSRLIRKAYFEQPDYVPLLQIAYKNWKHSEDITQEKVYYETGLLYFGKAGNWLMNGIHKSANSYDIPVKNIDDVAMAERYPQFKIPGNYEKLFEPAAGFLTPEKAIRLYTSKAKEHGATILSNTRVIGWQQHTIGIEVKTVAGNFFAKKLVITAGPWAGSLLPQLKPSLTVTRQVLAWVNCRDSERYSLGKIPCWILANDDLAGVYYGFPILPKNEFEGPIGFKLAYHFPGVETDPNEVNRLPAKNEAANLIDILHRFFPGSYKNTVALKTCLYTNTPDENFIIDYLPGHGKAVVFASGFSGHGFKFASVIGEILCDLVTKGSTSMPIEFLNAGRFL